MPSSARPLWLGLIVVSMASLAVGCTSNDESVSTTQATVDVSTTAAAADPLMPVAPTTTGVFAGPLRVGVGATALGEVLVDGDGLTLYALVDDPELEASCTGECAKVWPPYSLAPGAPFDATLLVLDDGLDESFIAITRQVDGSEQAAARGHVLYRFSGDTTAGDLNGHGVDDRWFAIDRNGRLIRTAQPAN